MGNKSTKFPIKVNEQVVEKKVLKSGDIIDVLGVKMRWESKSDARRKRKFFCVAFVDDTK